MPDTDGKAVGNANGDFVTDANGEIVISGLTPGMSVTVRETKTISGYVLDSTPQTVKIQSGEAQSVVFYNAPKGSLSVVKLDSLTEQPLSGAEFKVTTVKGEAVDTNEGRTSTNGIYRTDDNGRFTISGLQPGVYVVTETKAPAGYVLNSDTQTVTVNANDAQTLTFRNVPLQSLTIQKYEKGTTKPIQGAKFLVTDDDGKPVGESSGEFVTDENGQFILNGLTPGATITAKEIEAAEGYVLDGASKSIKIKSGAAQSLTFYNVPTQNLVIQKFVTDTTDPIPGVTFHVVNADGKAVGASNGDFVTDRNGKITITGLIPGDTLTVKETKTVSGYVLDSTPQTVKIQSGEAQVLTFFNTPKGSLSVKKLDSETGTPLAGAEFKVTTAKGEAVNQDEGRISTNGIYTTDTNGQFTLSKLEPGTYVVTETKAPAGYVLDSDAQTVTVNANDAQTLTFRNVPLQSLTIHKYIDGTTKPLAGVTFLVTDTNGKRIGSGEYITDANGQIVISGLTPGVSLVVREVRTVKGYVLNGAAQTVQIESGANLMTTGASASGTGNGNSLTFYDEPLSTLVIHKYISGTDHEPLAGVTFKVVDGSGKNVGNSDGIFVTDDSGDITISDLEPGTVIKAREIKTVDGYVLDGATQDIQIQNSELHELTFWNTPKQALTVQKYEKGTTQPIQGAKFLVTDDDGKPVGESNGEFVTDENGRFVLDNLTPGATITVKEIEAAEGYVLDGASKSIKIKSGDAQSVVFYNTPKGSLSVIKLDSLTEQPLSGAEFKVTTAKGEAVDQNEGRTSTNGIYRTDDNGRFTISGLQPGVYVVTETKAPARYVLDSQSQTVTVNANDAQTLTFRNVPLQSLKIQKYATGTTTPIQGAKFLITDDNGKPVGESSGEFVTDENGQIILNGLTPGATITAKEIEAAEGYVLDGASKSIKIKSGAAQSLVFYNALKGTLIVRKLDSLTEQPLSGAEFKVTTAKGEVVDFVERRTSSNGIYRTDASGQFILSDLQPGVYVVAESKAPDGYVLNTTAQTVTVSADNTQTLTFRDVPLQSLTIHKYEKGTTKPLAGVTFLVTDMNGKRIGSGEYTTDASGQIVISGLAPGVSLAVREVRTVKGYVLNGETQTIQIGIENAALSGSESGNSLTFYDEPLSTLVIHKYISGTDHDPLAGVTFKVVDGAGKNVGNSDGIFVTDNSGDITIPDLQPGTVIKAREIKTVDGYVLDGVAQDVQIQNSDVHELTFWNTPKQSLTVQKYAKGTTSPIQGTKFLVTDDDGKPVGESSGEFVTDENGRFVLNDLTPGVTITVKEIEAAEGYVLDGASKSIKIQSGAAQSVVFYNTPKGTLSVVKLDSLTEQPLSGAEFKVTTAKGEAVDQDEGQTSTNGIYRTDDSGRFTISGLMPGVYVVTETKAPAGYVLSSDAQTVTVNANDAQTLTFRDVALQSLKIQKYAKGTTTPIQGAKFLVTDDDGKPVGESSGEFVTDENGQIILNGLIPGATITAKEIEAAEGYVLDSASKSIKIKSGAAQSLTFYNVPTQNLVIQKFVTDTTDPIPGVTFHVVNADGKTVGDSNGDFVTDRNGKITITGLIPGDTLTVKEVKAASGYVLDSTPQTVKIQSGAAQSVVFYNTPKGSLSVVKLDSLTEQPLSGAEFKVTTTKGEAVDQNEGRTSTNGIYRTDDSGRFTISGLQPGVYVVTETKAPTGYVLDSQSQTVTVNANDAQTLTFRNMPLQSLKIQKYVKGTTTPIQGAKFLVTDDDGKPVGESSGEFVTDENGQIILNGLTPGATITAKEIEAADGYVLDSASKSIKIKSGAAQSLTFYNVPTQTLIVRKLVTDSTTPIFGVTFHVVNADGKTVGDSNGDFVTDRNGKITITGLIPGDTLTVKEVKAASGYVLDSTPQTVKIQSGAAQSVVFYNTPKGSLSVIKLDSLTEQPLSGAEFKVTTVKGEPVDANEGKTSTSGIYRTDDSGRFTISGLQPGMYVVTETKAPAGYVLDSQSQSVTVNANDAQTLTFRNVPLQSLKIQKYAKGTTTPIQCAKFLVTDDDGKPVGESRGEFVTDENGQIILNGLTPGATITVKEIEAAEGYVLDSASKSIKIKSGAAQSLTFYNVPTQNLVIQKFIDGTTKPLAGVTFLVTDTNGNRIGAGEYVTDANGQIILTGLTPGTTLAVREIRTVKGYVLNGAVQTIQIGSESANLLTSLTAVSGNSTGSGNSLTFYDEPLSTLVIHKYVTGTNNQPLAGVTFKVVDGSGKNVGNSDGIFVTDDSGNITISDLEPGTVIKAREIKTVDGYVLDGAAQDVQIQNSDVHELTFWNAPKQTIVIRKFVTGTTDPIPGVTFHVTNAEGKAVGASNGDFVTDKDGQIIISGLIPGDTLTVKETKTVSGYVLDSTPQTVKIQSGEAQSLTFFNAPKGALVVRATDSATEQPLANVEFKTVAVNGEPLDSNEGKTSSNGIYKTDDSGQITLTKIQPGIYTVTETKVPDGYLLNTEPQTVTVNADDTQTLVFRNTPKQALTIQVYEEGTTKPIAGIAFLLKDSGGAFIGPERGEFVTDANGQITVSGLTPGVTVMANEIRTVTGYVLNNIPQNIKIQTGDAQKLTFFNVPTQTLIIQKFQKGTTKPLAGVTFLVVDGSGKPFNGGEFVTDENGRIAIDGLEPGVTVTAREIRTVQGYQLNGNPQNIQISSTKQNILTFYDEPLSTLIIRLFVDGTENEPVSGAAFKVVDGSGKAVGPDDGIYYTDHAGMFTLENLEPGMTIKARLIRIAEEFTLDGTPQDILMESGDVQSLTFWAKRAGSLTIRSLDNVTRQPIPHVEFKITYADGRPVDTANGRQSSNGQYFTDTNGEIRITGITGTIVAVEERTASGYTMDSANRSQTVIVRPNDGQTLTFFDTPAQNLTVQLYVKGTTTPISGAKFLLTDGSGAKLGDENGEFTTDENGRFSLAGLTPGVTVKVKQLTTADGYLIDGAAKSIVIKTGNEQTVTVYNAPKQTLTVRLYVKDTETPISGAKFLLRDSGGALLGENNGVFTTDRNGEFSLTGLTPGVTVTATQTATISGYLLDTAPQSILIKSGNAQSLVFYNAPKGALIVKKLDAVTEKPLAGAEFKILTIGGKPVDDNEGKTSTNGIYRTDENGEITLLKLEPGAYTVTETKAPSGYTLDSQPQTVTVNADDRQTLVFRDTPLQSLTIQKYEDGTTKPLAGVTFLVTDANGGRIGAGEYTTDRNGQITITGLAPGMTVIAREVRTVKGYVLNGNPQTIVIGTGANTLTSGTSAGSSTAGGNSAVAGNGAAGGNTLTFYDAPLSTLVIRKFIEGTDNTPLANVEFQITDSKGAAVGNGTYYTDKSGEIRVDNLEPGMTVTVRETKTVSAYVLDGTPKTAEIPSGDVLEMVFWNARQQTLTINKFVSGSTTPIKGVTFLVTDQTGAPVGESNGEFVTDENGRIVIENLTPGMTITAKETKAADGYALDSAPKSILIKSGAAQSLNFYNSPTGTLIVTKRDRATEKPLKGATFQIMTADGKYVPNAAGQLSTNGLYTTDDKGQIMITGLSSDTLVVKETKAPDGYLLDDTPQTVKVGPNDTQTLTFYDDSKQTLTIQKFIEGTTKPVRGVTFLITDSKGEVVGSSNGEFQTDRNGRIVLTGLTPGMTITAKEVRTVEGYVLDTTPQSILVKEGEAQTLTFFNAPEGGLEVIKVDAADKSVRLPNTTFEIRKMDGALVKKITTDRDGRIHTDLDEGSYYLVEIEAAKGYKLDPTPEYFTVKDGKTTTVTVTNTAISGILLHKTDASTGKPLYGVTFLLYDAGNNPIGQYATDNQGYIRIEGLEAGKYAMRELENKGYVPDTQLKTVYVKSGETTLIEWKNIPVTAQIQITKKSADYNATNGLPAGTLLEGAIFEIRDKAGNLVDTVQSDRTGLAVTKPLPLGRYTIRETKAPANYGVNETEWTAYLEHEGQIVRFEITDKSLFTGVSITKTGPKQVMNGQPVIYRFSGIANTSNVRLDDFYWRDEIPPQVRLQSVVTGTYNFPGTYMIVYRVNDGEPRTLADNLSTRKNYTLAASPTALGLKANELLTEITFVFGQAPAGFAQVEAPILNCTAIPNILAYSFVNQADVGGVYNGKWVQGISRWVTTVYKKPAVKLPRTGY